MVNPKRGNLRLSSNTYDVEMKESWTYPFSPNIMAIDEDTANQAASISAQAFAFYIPPPPPYFL